MVTYSETELFWLRSRIGRSVVPLRSTFQRHTPYEVIGCERNSFRLSKRGGSGAWSAGEAVAGAANQDCFGQAGQGGDGGVIGAMGPVFGDKRTGKPSFGR